METFIKHSNPEALAKRIVYTAFNASQVMGMGIFMDRGDQTEDEVWESAVGRHDYPGRPSDGYNRVYCDYVNGRMMKLDVRWDDLGVYMPSDDHTPRLDYQSWCGTYPTYSALVDEAVNSLD